MFSEFDEAVAGWAAEVDAEATRLVRQGYAPWEARARAVENVRRRRQARRQAEELVRRGLGESTENNHAH